MSKKTQGRRMYVTRDEGTTGWVEIWSCKPQIDENGYYQNTGDGWDIALCYRDFTHATGLKLKPGEIVRGRFHFEEE